jgi:hypothetical protein
MPCPRLIALVSLGLSLFAMTPSARALPNCSEFFYNMDGTWSPTHPIMMAGPTSQTTIGPSDKLGPGMPGLAGRLGAYLNAKCAAMRPSAARSIPRLP